MKEKDEWFDMCNCDDECNCNCNTEQTELEKEWAYLELLSRRIDIANGLLLLMDSKGDPLYTKEWVKENIIKI